MTVRHDRGMGEGHPKSQRSEPAEISGFLTRQDMVDCALRLMSLRGQGRIDELVAGMTEDCEMIFPGLPGISPFNGTFKGRSACHAALKANHTLIEFIDLRAVSVMAQGDTVMVRWSCGMRNRGTGPTLPVEGLARLRFRNKLMCLYENHLDTAAVAALAGYPRVPSL